MTTFDLDKSIAAWRRRYEHDRAFLPEDIRELERHVRDHVEALVEQGRSEEEAFLGVLREIGEHEEVQAAYRRVLWGKLSRECSVLHHLSTETAMFGDYLKTALHSLLRQKGYAFINVAGLTIGLACCMLIFQFVAFQKSFDGFHDKAGRRFATLFGAFTGIAILIAYLGLFGLASFTAAQRTKEIGVRKVLGASVGSIVGLLSKDFVILVGIAFLIAAPAACFAMNRWLEEFAYRIEISAGIFLLTGGLVLLARHFGRMRIRGRSPSVERCSLRSGRPYRPSPSRLLTPLFLVLACCSNLDASVGGEIPHRYFKEVDRPGVLAAELFSGRGSGRFVRLLEIDEVGRVVGDTLLAWVQHFGPGRALSPNAARAGLIVTCHRQLLPGSAQSRHVLAQSRGEIYVYAMRGGILVISAARIPYYEVLTVPDGSVEGYVHRRSNGST